MDGYAEFTQAHPEVPWRSMRGMRNRIAHGYFDMPPEAESKALSFLRVTPECLNPGGIQSGRCPGPHLPPVRRQSLAIPAKA